MASIDANYAAFSIVVQDFLCQDLRLPTQLLLLGLQLLLLPLILLQQMALLPWTWFHPLVEYSDSDSEVADAETVE